MDEPVVENPMGEDKPFTIDQEVKGENINFGPGFAASVSANQDLTMSQAGAISISAANNAEISYGGALVISAGNSAEVSYGGANMINAGGNMEVAYGGAFMLNAGGNVDVEYGGAMVINASTVTASNSKIGAILSGNVTLGENNTILLDTPRAIAFGAAAGAVFALISLLLRRK